MKKYLALILIVVLGLLLRFYHNLDISLWHDEAFSALMIRYPWTEMFYRLGLDVHPPAYYTGLRLWHYVFGDTLLSLRGFSIFFGTATILAGWAFCKEAFKNEKAALWAALLIAVNPFQLHYVTEARMYTFGAFFALLAGYFLVKGLNWQKEFYEAQKLNMPSNPDSLKARKKILWNYFGFSLCLIVIIFTHYYLFFTAAALGLYAFIYLLYHGHWNYKKFVPIFLSYIIAGVAFLPWLKTFLFQYRQVQAGYWIQAMDRWSIPSTFWDMLIGFQRDMGKAGTHRWLLILTLFSVLFLAFFLKRTQSFHKWLVVMAIAAPFGGALLFALLANLKGSSSSVYLDRYFLFASLYYSIALAVWLKEIKIKWLSIALLVFYVGFNFYAIKVYWRNLDVDNKPGMAAAAKFLTANVEPKQHVFLGTSYEFFNYKYYAQTGFPIPTAPLLFTGGRAKAEQMSHVEGVAMLTDADLVPDFAKAVKTGDTVWLIWTYAFGSNKPQLPLNWVQIDQKEYADVRPYAGTVIYVTQYKVN
jgi:hypothetical protein